MRSNGPELRRRVVLNWGSALVRAPVDILRTRHGIYLVFLVVIVFNLLTAFHLPSDWRTPGWLFDGMPKELWRSIAHPLVAIGVVGVFCAAIFLDVIVSLAMMSALQGSPTGALRAATQIRLSNILWLASASAICNAIFAVIALAVYIPARLVWDVAHVDLTILVGVAAVLAYPAWYGVTATCAMVSVFPPTSINRLAALKSLWHARIVGTLYLYYGARVAIELALLAAAPLIAINLLHNRLLASVAIALGLLAPAIFLRSGTYAVNLQAMRSTPGVVSLFKNHFDRLGGRAQSDEANATTASEDVPNLSG